MDVFNMLVSWGDWQRPGESICWRLECALNSTIESWCTEVDTTGEPQQHDEHLRNDAEGGPNECKLK